MEILPIIIIAVYAVCIYLFKNKSKDCPKQTIIKNNNKHGANSKT